MSDLKALSVDALNTRGVVDPSTRKKRRALKAKDVRRWFFVRARGGGELGGEGSALNLGAAYLGLTCHCCMVA